jgi:hypothetical protein
MTDTDHMARVTRAADTIAGYGTEADTRAMIVLQAAAWHLYRRYGALAAAESLFALGEVFADEVPAQPRVGRG